MRIKYTIITFLLSISLSGSWNIFSVPSDINPVTPNASVEAKALLKLMYDLTGKYMLTGQHNYPNTKNNNTLFASSWIGKTPVVYSADWGFSANDDKDSYLARPEIVKELIRQHKLGSIITICWHAVPPTANEPVTFQPLPGADPGKLESVQGQLTEKQYKDLLTPGTPLYKNWCKQVDTIAYYLKLLQDARVPILWRPYHEMNGSWFWWGGRTGTYSTVAIYKQLFNRLTHHHKLTNLLWVWSVDRPTRPEMSFSNFYPGNNFLDIVALDVYGNDFSQTYYDSLKKLSNGKPMILAEVGHPPSKKILDNQPNWCLYATWAGMVRNTTKKEYKDLMDDSRILNLDDSVYWAIATPYRIACGLPNHSISEKLKINFSGSWIINEEKSILNTTVFANEPYGLEILQDSNKLQIKKIYLAEYTHIFTTEDILFFNEKENKLNDDNLSRVSSLKKSEKGDTLFIHSVTTYNRNGRPYEIIHDETWTLSKDGNRLSVHQTQTSMQTKKTNTFVFDLIPVSLKYNP